LAVDHYAGTANIPPGPSPKTGILVTNLGSPDAPAARAVRPYLREFLSDPRVIEAPPLIWWFILTFTILPFRPRKSAALYKKIWTEEGSPLVVNSRRQKEALEQLLENRVFVPPAVELGMRYGNPSIADALERLRQRGIDRLLVLPLYPQYSGTTSGSTFDAVSKVLQTWRRVPDFRLLMSYHDHPGYIEALAESVHEHWNREGRAEKFVISFHGIPKRYVDNGDPYFDQCRETARLLAGRLGLKTDGYLLCFQSLFGNEEWLRPYASELIEELGRSGTRSLYVICPGFAADFLETLEEIYDKYSELFLKWGGEKFRYIPALNYRQQFIEALADIALECGGGWLESRKRHEAERVRGR
jgi:ferrochelatase